MKEISNFCYSGCTCTFFTYYNLLLNNFSDYRLRHCDCFNYFSFSTVKLSCDKGPDNPLYAALQVIESAQIKVGGYHEKPFLFDVKFYHVYITCLMCFMRGLYTYWVQF